MIVSVGHEGLPIRDDVHFLLLFVFSHGESDLMASTTKVPIPGAAALDSSPFLLNSANPLPLSYFVLVSCL